MTDENEPLASPEQSWLIGGIAVTEEPAARLLEQATPEEAAAVVTELRAHPEACPDTTVMENVTPKEPES